VNQITTSSYKKQGFITNSTLAMTAFCSGFLSRCLSALKFPSIINLAHLLIVPFVFIIILSKTRINNDRQIKIIKKILFAILLFLIVVLASALVNDAGTINAVMGFLLLTEPFMLIIIIVSIPMTLERSEWFQKWIIRFCLFHTFLAFVQNYILKFNLKEGLEDNIQGIFYRSGSGHVVGASVALTFGIYYFLTTKVSLWIRTTVLLATLWHVMLADAKQVIICLAFAGVLLVLTKVKDIKKLISYTTVFFIIAIAFFWGVENIESFSAFKTWMRPEIYGSEGEATLLKIATFRIVPQYFSSPIGWFLGLGPGHTVGRLGGWMIENYWNLLGPLGATKSPASAAVWAAVGRSWLGDQSSFFSPLFGWAGVWGDYGPVGLVAYLYLSALIWRYFCLDDFSKFLALCVVSFGLVFSQMEEPGYMLFIAYLIALRWQQSQQNNSKGQYYFIAPNKLN
jgi:hypothetical protein